MPLRPYQEGTINKIYASLRAGHHRIVVQQPPRTGKTVIMAEIAKRATAKGNRVLTVVHRQELVEQTQRTFDKWGVDTSLCHVGMVQTLWRRVRNNHGQQQKHGAGVVNIADPLRRKPAKSTANIIDEPTVIIIDEAHHALARSYQSIIEAFPNAIVLMFTATPYRLSGAGMGEVADDLIEGLQVQELIDMGYLAPVKYFAPPDINLAILRRAKGEFTNQSIDEALDKRVYGNAVGQYKKHAAGMKAIAYCSSVQNAKKLAKQFNDAGVPALEVDGSTPKDERAKAVERFRSGDIMVMTNVELFTEGLDLPNVDCVIQLRPTQSLGLYMQFAMRSMNPREGKTAVIIDHVKNVERFGLPTDDREWHLEGGNKSGKPREAEEQPKAIKNCPNCFGTFYSSEVIDNKCPLCGVELPVAVQEREPDADDTELAEIINSKRITAADRRLKRVHKIQKLNAIKELAGKSVNDLTTKHEFDLYASAMGYKPGWAYYQAKERGII